MSEEITSLEALEYFEGQCYAYFRIPQTRDDKEERIQGMFSYQEDKISFSFMFEYMGKIEDPRLLYTNPKYKTLYIFTNKKIYTIHKPYSQKTSGYTLGHPTQITLHYEWLFNDWIEPEAIRGAQLAVRTNYLESFFARKQHLLYEFEENENKENIDENFTQHSFYVQKDFVSKKFEKDKIKAKRFYTLFPSKQQRFFSCQCDLYLECNITFENLEDLASIAEAIKNFFVLIYAYSKYPIQIDFIRFIPQNSKEYITAVSNTCMKDKKNTNIEHYGVSIHFFQMENFSVILEKWIEFYIQNKNFHYVSNILEVINRKDQTFHLYSDLLFLIGMLENFIEQQKIAKIDEEISSQQIKRVNLAIEILEKNGFSNKELYQYRENLMFSIENIGLRKKLLMFLNTSLSKTKCEQLKNHFSSKNRKKLCQQIVKYRNALAHGSDLKLDTDKAIKISNVFVDLIQIIIEYFFGKIGLSIYIEHNASFSFHLKTRSHTPVERKNKKTDV